ASSRGRPSCCSRRFRMETAERRRRRHQTGRRLWYNRQSATCHRTWRRRGARKPMRASTETPWLRAAAPLGAACRVFGPTLVQWQLRWATDPQYSHGYFVPAFALALLWLRRPMLRGEPLVPRAWGLALVGLAAAMRLGGAFFYAVWVEQIALLPLLA